MQQQAPNFANTLSKDLSIIIPTYNEGDNIELLVSRITKSLAVIDNLSYEIIFVDDSNDNTPAVLANCSECNPNIIYRHREKNSGLSSAVVEGFHLSCSQYLVVMDADLQHPPELLPEIWHKLHAGFDFVIPSRFIAGGSDGGIAVCKKLISLVARMLAWMTITRVRHIRDCTSGYFGIKRAVINNKTLATDSWKIILEILVKGNYVRLIEIPYKFALRHAGKTKLCWREYVKYIKHLIKLAKYNN